MVTRTDAGIERAVTEPADHDITELLTGELLDRANHPLWRECRPGWKFPLRFFSGSENLHVSSADIDH